MYLWPLVDAAYQRMPIALVLADAEFDSERNHQPVRQILSRMKRRPVRAKGADMSEAHMPNPPKRGARIYDRLRQPGASLITSLGIGVVLLAIVATLFAVVVAIIW